MRNRNQILRFIVSGCAAVGTDLCIYQLLFTVCSHEVSKGISFLCGTLLAYLLNKFWTFQRAPHSWTELSSFALLYTATLCLNVSVNQMALNYLPWLGAFLAATGASTIANFLGQKFWVFKSSSKTPILNPES